uniref:mRNA interferase MazF n=1 Tax=Candidatus Kentrum sp. FW TaxID=2126338 RepID=A0A450TS24_9GAMM|nr:MAG: mRNA interferase MazF [Candidatus Kentron sp. FW]
MPSMTTYSFGDVVLVSFPFTNLQTAKKRPAVVISQKTYQQNRSDVILMAVTGWMQETPLSPPAQKRLPRYARQANHMKSRT